MTQKARTTKRIMAKKVKAFLKFHYVFYFSGSVINPNFRYFREQLKCPKSWAGREHLGGSRVSILSSGEEREQWQGGHPHLLNSFYGWYCVKPFKIHCLA